MLEKSDLRCIYMTYYSHHSLPTQEEKMRGNKLGTIIDRGFRIHFPQISRTIDISTFKLTFFNTDEQASWARRKILRRLGQIQQGIPIF